MIQGAKVGVEIENLTIISIQQIITSKIKNIHNPETKVILNLINMAADTEIDHLLLLHHHQVTRPHPQAPQVGDIGIEIHIKDSRNFKRRKNHTINIPIQNIRINLMDGRKRLMTIVRMRKSIQKIFQNLMKNRLIEPHKSNQSKTTIM